MRLEGKVAVIVGAGQSPGEGIGNGRATTRFTRAGVALEPHPSAKTTVRPRAG